jgi:hypothetical protein
MLQGFVAVDRISVSTRDAGKLRAKINFSTFD